jgi:hypothetical protein
METLPRGLRPHTHAQRSAIVDQLLPLWQRKFGSNLLAVAICASYARGADLPYSDLEFEVFLRQPLPEGEERYLQRIVDGMLVEALYDTEESYLSRHTALSADWPLAASETLVAVYNQPFITSLTARIQAVRYPREAFILQACHRFYEVQEASGKVLNAIETGNRQGLPLLLFDAVMHMLAVLSFLNQTPYITFASFITQARDFPVGPPGFSDLLDIVVNGAYADFPRVQSVLLGVIRGFEVWFETAGYPLYDQSIDPNLPNRRCAPDT